MWICQWFLLWYFWILDFSRMNLISFVLITENESIFIKKYLMVSLFIGRRTCFHTSRVKADNLFLPRTHFSSLLAIRPFTEFCFHVTSQHGTLIRGNSVGDGASSSKHFSPLVPSHNQKKRFKSITELNQRQRSL